MPGSKNWAGMIPTFALPGREHAGAVGADQPHAGLLAPSSRCAACRATGIALGDRDHRVDAGVDRLVDRRRRRSAPGRRSSRCWRRARRPPRRSSRRPARRRRPGRPCPASRRRPGRSRSRGCAARGRCPRGRSGPETTSFVSVSTTIAIRALHRPDRDLVEGQPAVDDSVAEKLERARRLGAPQPVRASQAATSIGWSRSLTSTTRGRGPGRLAPLGLGVVADVRRVAQPLGLLAGSPMKSVSTISTRSRETRAISWTAARVGEVVRRGPARRRRRSSRPANGRSSAGQTTSACIPGAGSHGDHLDAGLAQPPGHVSSPGRDVERGPRAAAHSTRRSRSGPARCASDLDVGLRALVQRSVRSSASSTRSARAVEHRRLDVQVRRRRLAEDPPALLRVRPVEPHDDRVLDRPSARAPAGSRARPRRSA